MYRGKLILYGCGDFIDDYEGIVGYDEYRVDLRLAHIAELDADTGALARLRMLPLQARQLRLCPASDRDAGWLCTKLDRVSRAFGSRIVRDPAGALVLRWTDG